MSGMMQTGKSLGITAIFMLVADVAIAGGTGLVGIHGLAVDGGINLGKAWGIPQIDWFNLWDYGELDFIDIETDPCISEGGHYHKNGVCHYPDTAALPNIAEASFD